jgi:hypothetical protein
MIEEGQAEVRKIKNRALEIWQTCVVQGVETTYQDCLMTANNEWFDLVLESPDAIDRWANISFAEQETEAIEDADGIPF